jgi:hypothetical protein
MWFMCVRPVPGFPNYFVDIMGGTWSNRKNGSLKTLQGTIERDGYRRVMLRRDGKSTLMLVLCKVKI